MHDLVIRNGKVVDGSGEEAFMGDIAIDGDRITKVGLVEDQGKAVSYTHLTLPTKA